MYSYCCLQRMDVISDDSVWAAAVSYWALTIMLCYGTYAVIGDERTLAVIAGCTYTYHLPITAHAPLIRVTARALL